MRHLLEAEGIAAHVELDSAGTGGWHAGDPPDPRSREAAGRRGIVIDGAARQVATGDFYEFDLILAMDRANLRDLRAVAPEDATAEIRLLLGDADVPDPYYGGERGFDDVIDLVDGACREMLEELRR